MEMQDGVKKSTIKPDNATRKPKGFKIALIALAVLFILFATSIYLLPHFLPIGTVRSIAKSKAKEMANMDVDFSNLRFGWNGDLVIDDIVVSPLGPDGTPAEPILTVKEARTNVALAPLLSGRAIVNSFDMEGFVLKIRRDADGSLNIPDFNAARNGQQAARRTRRTGIPLTAAAETEQPAIPPIELHQVNFRDGIVSYTDAGQDLDLDIGVQFLRIDGKSLDDPFLLSGRLTPYPNAPNLGDLPFTGRVALLKNGAFNPEGEANLEVDVKNLSLHEMLDKFHMGNMVPSAQADGLIKAAYNHGRAMVNIPELRLSNASVDIGGQHVVSVPDTSASLNAVFDPDSKNVLLDDLSITNILAAIRANGRIEGVDNLANGQTPAATLDFSGAADFAGATAYLSSQKLLPAGLPELNGKATFVGKLAAPAQSSGNLHPALTVDFNDGNIQATDHNSGIAAGLELKGVGVRAAAALGDEATVNADVSFADVPAHALLPQFGNQPVNVTLNGGAALDHAAGSSRVELRLDKSRAIVPATPWSNAANIQDAEARIIADLNRDAVEIHGLKATVNNVIQGGITSGNVTGIMAGNPQGQANLEISGLMEHIKQFLSPVFPHAVLPTLTGSLRGATRLKLEGREAEALVRGELDETHIVVNVVPGESQAEVQAPKATFAVLTNLNLDRLGQIAVQSLEAAGDGTTVRFTDVSGSTVQGQTGNALVKAAGKVDADAKTGHFTNLTLDVNGMNVALGQGGQQVAALTSGLMKVVAAAPEQAMLLPLEGQGDFSLPNINLGVDNLMFQYQDEQSNFGNLRARFAVDGYIGQEKRQLINMRTASLSAAPVAVNSRGQFDLGSGALLAEYAARVAPAAMSSLLGYLGMPPALLTDAAATGTVSYNGSVISTKGAVQGQLRTGQNETNPFELAHDLSAAWNPDDSSLALDIRRLDGNVKTQAGEAVATMMAQQSKLLLSRAGSKGLLDIRFNGSAEPTRHFALGLAGLFPSLGSLANTLHSTQVGGVYNAWLQVRDKDPVTLAINAGSVWQGAALALDGVPYVSEAAKLSAAIEGDFAYQDNQVRLSRLLVRSDSGMMQADGTAALALTSDQNNMPSGLGHVELDMRFVMADIRKAAMVLPTVVPGDLGLSGRLDGQFKAGGDMNDIRIDTGLVRFQRFTARPSPDLEVTIPDGQAQFGGVINLHLAGGGGGQPWDVVRLFNVHNGQLAVTGMQIHGKTVNEFSTAFQLENGVAAIQSARVTVGGGSEGQVMLNGVVDFNQPAPAVNARLALANIPLSEVNAELKDFFQFEAGAMNLPAQSGTQAAVAFAGFSEDEILRTIRLDNFTFVTTPVTMLTGPALNAELDKARVIMKQNTTEEKSRRVTFSRISGSFRAAGDGTIHIPQDAPIDLIGADTADFRAFGSVYANHTIDLRVMVAGKIEQLIGFTIPNLIPNLGALGSGGTETTNRFMASMNESAAQGKYGVQVRGPLERPDISGIGQLAGQFLTDIVKSELLGGIIGLGKDVPGAIGNVVGGVLTNPKDAIQNLPENLVNAPENVLKGLGQMFGVEASSRGAGQGAGQEQQQYQEQQPQQQQQQRQQNPREMLRGIGQRFGIR